MNGVDSRVVELALKLYEKIIRKSGKELTEQVLKTMTDTLSYHAFTKTLESEISGELYKDLERGKLIHTLFVERNKNGRFSLEFKLDHKIIGIGAPAQAYLPKVSQMLKTGLTVPEHFEVANAVGAIVGRIIAEVQAVIKVGDCNTFTVSTENSREVFQDLADATRLAYRQAETLALQKAQEMGAQEIDLSVYHETQYGTARDSDVFLQRTVTARAETAPL